MKPAGNLKNQLQSTGLNCELNVQCVYYQLIEGLLSP